MSDRPNILLILTDQHRLSALSCYGETPCRTPHIDGLAAQGVRFETAYTACPVCSPARATVMTGLYPHAHGICSNVHNLGSSVHELSDGPDLLSRRLQSAGYRLGYTGKWHLGTERTDAFGSPVTPCLPKDVGFEGQNFPGHGGGGFGYDEYKRYLADHGWEHRVDLLDETGQRGGGTLAGPVESTVPYFLTQHSIDRLDEFRAGDGPFFLWHNFWGPHGPYYATREYVDLYRDVPIPEWPNYGWPARSIPGPHWNKIHPRAERMTWRDWEEQIRYYYAFTSMIDDQIGRLLAHLDATGLAEDTVVIFAADHGETLGSHGGLTDKGFHHFEETHRIPMMARFPDGRWAGRVVDGHGFASLADLYPTILDLAGAEAPAGRHGASLLPWLQGDEAGRDEAVTEFCGVNDIALTQRTLRWRDWKYGYNCSGPDELYDLAADPAETRNLIDHVDSREVARELRQRLLAWMERTGDPARRIFAGQKVAYYDGAN
jgi:arylsulfatase A-like enzyme